MPREPGCHSSQCRAVNLMACRVTTCTREVIAHCGNLLDHHGSYAGGCAPRRREEVRDVTIDSKQPCCTRDEGRPLGLGLQDQGPNHRKPRRSNGRGGERSFVSEQDYSSRDTLQNEAATTSIEALARLRIAIPVLPTPIRL